MGLRQIVVVVVVVVAVVLFWLTVEVPVTE
jgi:hypothetical protein